MKVKELSAILSKCDGEMEVFLIAGNLLSSAIPLTEELVSTNFFASEDKKILSPLDVLIEGNPRVKQILLI